MEVIVQEIARRVREALSISDEDKEAMKLAEAEIMAVVNSGQVIDNIDTVTLLERRIRERISSTESSRIGVHKAKRAGTDEWAWLDAYAAATAKKEERQKAIETRRRKQAALEELRQYTVAVKQRKKVEKEARSAEIQRVNADVKAWRDAEMAARDARRNAALLLKSERQAQLDQLHSRQELARLLCRAAEMMTAETAAAEARRASEAEKSAREKARREMNAVIEGNVAAERARRNARAAEQAFDRQCMEQYSRILAKQEAERAAQLDRVRAVQAAQAADAATRPPIKRWVDVEVIERQAAKAEAQAAQREAERIAAATAVARACADEIAQQLKEHEAARAAAAAERAAERHAVAVAAASAAAEDAQRARKVADASRRLKEDLDAQLAEKRANPPHIGMDENERKLNAGILKAAKEAYALKNDKAKGCA